jgi:hypothetical protein
LQDKTFLKFIYSPVKPWYSLSPRLVCMAKYGLSPGAKKGFPSPLFTSNAFNQVELKAKAGIKENAHF